MRSFFVAASFLGCLVGVPCGASLLGSSLVKREAMSGDSDLIISAVRSCSSPSRSLSSQFAAWLGLG